MPSKRKQIGSDVSQGGKEDSRPKSTRSEIITAVANVMTIIGVFLTLWQIMMLKSQVQHETIRLKKLTAIESLRDWNRNQPTNAFHCIKFMANLEQRAFEGVLNRDNIPLTKDDSSQANRCLSDLNFYEYFRDGSLTKKGSSKITERVNTAVNADETVLLGYTQSIGDEKIIQEQLRNPIDVCETKFIEKLRKVRGHSDSYPAIAKYLIEHPVAEHECK